MSIANMSAFIQARAAARMQETPSDPESRLMTALSRQGSVLLPDIPGVLEMSAEEALPVVERLRDRGLAVLMERNGTQYLMSSAAGKPVG